MLLLRRRPLRWGEPGLGWQSPLSIPRPWLAAIFAACALFAAGMGVFSTDALHRLWGMFAAVAYVLGVVVLVAWRSSRAVDIALLLGVGGALIVPMSLLAEQGRWQPEVGVIARGARLLVQHGSPYESQAIVSASHDPNIYNPYLPVMAIFGLPRALLGPGLVTDPRVWFTLGFVAVFATAAPSNSTNVTGAPGRIAGRALLSAEGDPYNKALIDRAERRLKNLNYFKTVKISSKPGSVSDRVVLDVDVVEQQTGDFSISGGYSTTDGLLAEVKLGDRNFFGTGKALNASVTYGQYARGVDLSASEPYFLGSRVAAGIELYGRQNAASPYQSYGNDIYGATMQLGTPLTEQLGMQWRYSVYNQNITLNPTALTAAPSLPIQQAALAGPAWVSSVGDTVTYNTLDNNKMPTSGINSQLKQDLAGLGGDVKFLRTTEDVHYYHELNSDVVSLVRAQGGYITGWGGQQVPLINSFFGGPTMVRGFAPNGFGPRDLTPGTTMDNVGGSMYWATTAELQSAIPGIPREYGLKASAFVDAGSVFHYGGPTVFPGSAQSLQVANANVVRSSVGAGLTWASPFGALTVSYAVPLTKAAYDVVQPFSFGAGPLF